MERLNLYSAINWNGYYNLDKYFLLVPYVPTEIYKYAFINHQIEMQGFAECQIIDVKTFYGSKITDFIAFAAIGHDSTFLKTVLAETYFKGHEHKLTMVERQLWALAFVKEV